MKLRHTAALALTGWYLMVPPPEPSHSTLDARTKEPLSQWVRVGTYDTATECEAEREQVRLEATQAAGKYGLNQLEKPTTRDELIASEASAALCVAADDPRLKQN